MGRPESSNIDFRAINFNTMKQTNYAEVPKSLMLQEFWNIEKARWFRIKTIVLIWWS